MLSSSLCPPWGEHRVENSDVIQAFPNHGCLEGQRETTDDTSGREDLPQPGKRERRFENLESKYGEHPIIGPPRHSRWQDAARIGAGDRLLRDRLTHVNHINFEYDTTPASGCP
jgi:hypothetical protein